MEGGEGEGGRRGGWAAGRGDKTCLLLICKAGSSQRGTTGKESGQETSQGPSWGQPKTDLAAAVVADDEAVHAQVHRTPRIVRRQHTLHLVGGWVDGWRDAAVQAAA